VLSQVAPAQSFMCSSAAHLQWAGAAGILAIAKVCLCLVERTLFFLIVHMLLIPHRTLAIELTCMMYSSKVDLTCADCISWPVLAYSNPITLTSCNFQTLAHMFELGCIVHSVIIGIMLGVIDRDFPQARCARKMGLSAQHL